eukprot:Skav205526  [mRNA]  locus=scaffold4253:159885:167015:+ [translate_table: standard]
MFGYAYARLRLSMNIPISVQGKLVPLKSARAQLSHRAQAQAPLGWNWQPPSGQQHGWSVKELRSELQSIEQQLSGDVSEQQLLQLEKQLQGLGHVCLSKHGDIQRGEGCGGCGWLAVSSKRSRGGPFDIPFIVKASQWLVGHEEMEEIQKRIKEFTDQVKALQDRRRQSGERVILEAIQKEAAERLEAFQESLTKARDAEGPFLMCAEEDLPLEKSLSTVKDCENKITCASTAGSIVKIYLMIKGAEVKKFVPETCKEGTEKITEFQTKMEAPYQRLPCGGPSSLGC